MDQALTHDTSQSSTFKVTDYTRFDGPRNQRSIRIYLYILVCCLCMYMHRDKAVLGRIIMSKAPSEKHLYRNNYYLTDPTDPTDPD